MDERTNRLLGGEAIYQSLDILGLTDNTEEGESVISVFLAKGTVLAERRCPGYISLHREMPLPVI